jgi:predicted transcriptional regulator
MATRVVTAHLPAELAEQLDALAGHLDRPRGWLVKEAVEAYVNLAEARRRETLEALNDVDAGRVVEHDEVDDWASALKASQRRRKRKG